jgi:hypothetical protein
VRAEAVLAVRVELLREVTDARALEVRGLGEGEGVEAARLRVARIVADPEASARGDYTT